MMFPAFMIMDCSFGCPASQNCSKQRTSNFSSRVTKSKSPKLAESQGFHYVSCFVFYGHSMEALYLLYSASYSVELIIFMYGILFLSWTVYDSHAIIHYFVSHSTYLLFFVWWSTRVSILLPIEQHPCLDSKLSQYL